MINIIDKHNCCGCNACTQKCPKGCIIMHEDEEGFLYPQVDETLCINCGLCEKVCPVINQGNIHQPIEVYAAKNPNEEIRQQSSSGGIFTMLAEQTIDNGGVVFGVGFDQNWTVVHQYTQTKEGLAAFRGSKYVQSYIGDSFKQVETFLKQGREVLFSGTPCQIKGLRLFLHKEYDNLLTVDFICHGVPSPKIWREYLESLHFTNIGDISHKDKSTGWRGYSITIKDMTGNILLTERASENKYMMAFNRNLTLRPSCFSCPAKSGKSRADITLADYWGIEHFIPQMDDNKGTSFLCVNTIKGNTFIEKLNVQIERVDYTKTIRYNPCVSKSTSEPVDRERFWNDYTKMGINALLSQRKQKQNIFSRIIKRIIR